MDLSRIAVGKRIRMFFTSESSGMPGRVEGIERSDDDRVMGLKVLTPCFFGGGIMDVDGDVMRSPGFRIEVEDDVLVN